MTFIATLPDAVSSASANEPPCTSAESREASASFSSELLTRSPAATELKAMAPAGDVASNFSQEMETHLQFLFSLSNDGKCASSFK